MAPWDGQTNAPDDRPLGGRGPRHSHGGLRWIMLFNILNPLIAIAFGLLGWRVVRAGAVGSGNHGIAPV